MAGTFVRRAEQIVFGNFVATDWPRVSPQVKKSKQLPTRMRAVPHHKKPREGNSSLVLEAARK